MVKDLDKQLEKKKNYSRKRAEKASNDIDYINERNMRFNRKIDSAYGRFTTEIKQNLERGTAV
jgi:pre-mRNA-splicing factor SYF2